jgi:hypothetical protein
VSTYHEYYSELKIPDGFDENLPFPAKGYYLDKFEELNDLTISVYTWDTKKGLLPHRITKNNRVILDYETYRNRHVDLMLITDESKCCLDEPMKANECYECDHCGKRHRNASSHYILMKSLEAFLRMSNADKGYYCIYCLTKHYGADELLNHYREGMCLSPGDPARRIVLPAKDKAILKWNSNKLVEKRYPFCAYGDIESVLMKPITKKFMELVLHRLGKHSKCKDRIMSKISEYAGIIMSFSSDQYQAHIALSAGVTIVVTDECRSILGDHHRTWLYRQASSQDERPLVKMLKHLKGELFQIRGKILAEKKRCEIPPSMLIRANKGERFFTIDDAKGKVMSDSKGVMKFKTGQDTDTSVFSHITAQDIKLNVLFHNLKGYDSHLILQDLKGVKWNEEYDKPHCIPQSSEKFVMFEVGGLVFKDSAGFLKNSLDNLSRLLVTKSKTYDAKKGDADQSPSIWSLIASRRDIGKIEDTISEYAGEDYWAQKESYYDVITAKYRHTRDYYRDRPTKIVVWEPASTILEDGKSIAFGSIKQQVASRHDKSTVLIPKVVHATKKIYVRGEHVGHAAINKYNFPYSKIYRLTEKNECPYDYITSLSRLREHKLPDAEWFVPKLKAFNSLRYTSPVSMWAEMSSEDRIETRRRANKAQEMFEMLGCSTIGQYLDWYLRTDVLLLADVFEDFRSMSLSTLGIDPLGYYTLPGLTMAANLKHSNQSYDLFNSDQVDMHLMIEAGIRGGTSMIPNSYARANNKYCPDYDASKPTSYFIYLDANALYSKGMLHPVPYGDFKWESGWDEKRVMAEALGWSLEQKRGWTFEVDLVYPKHLHDSHSDFALAPETCIIPEEDMSEWAKQLLRGKGHRDGRMPEHRKLVCRLTNKNNYVVHYVALKKYIELGLIVSKVHRVLGFGQSRSIAPYVQDQMDKRAVATNDFEKEFRKLLSNALFGKMMENMRKREKLEMVMTEAQHLKLVSKHTFHSAKQIAGGLELISMRNNVLKMNKPIYIGQAILDISKTVIYDFHYNVIKANYGSRAKLCMHDTDSLGYLITAPDGDIPGPNGWCLYKDMCQPWLKKHLDCSPYLEPHAQKWQFVKDNPGLTDADTANKKVPGMFKDVAADKNLELILEFVGLLAKMYSCKTLSAVRGSKLYGQMSTAKGVKDEAGKLIVHQRYKDCLFGYDLMTEEEKKYYDDRGEDPRNQYVSFCMMMSRSHEIFTGKVTKRSLSPADTKFYKISPFTSYAYGHYMIDRINGLD